MTPLLPTRSSVPTRIRGTRQVRLLVVAAFLVAVTAEFESSAAERSTSHLPRGVVVEADSFQELEGGEIVLDGAVTLSWSNSRFQADRIVIKEQRFIEAEGNVLVAWGGNRISGSRMTYDLELDTGLIQDARGEIEPEFFVSAKELTKIGEDKLHLESATVTTCTQPLPYWSFTVSSADIRLDHYAHLKNMRLKAGKLPVFYLPYMVWPVKRDRSAGLLFPDFGSTEERGNVFALPLFIPIGRSADVTLVGEYYTKAGLGVGADFRFVPNVKGAGNVSGFYIDDEVAGPEVCEKAPCARWRFSYQETQQFLNGFRMVADINQVSDFDYFSDFERDIRLVSSPSVLGRLEFSRNGAWTSVNIRDFRREQLVFAVDAQGIPFRDTLVQQTLPEVELRGRDRRLGNTPFYLSYESSLASIQQFGPTIDADYMRLDLFPRVTIPLSRLPWLQVNPRFDYRLTYYSQSQVQDPSSTDTSIVDTNLTRGIAAAGIDIVGPKFSRIFRRGEGQTSYKNLIEPRIVYGFRESFDDAADVILYDEVDLISPENFVTYSIRSLLFAKRPRAASPAALGSGESIVWPTGDAISAAEVEPFSALDPRGLPDAPIATTGLTEPLEIASLELSQTRSVDDILMCADLDGDDLVEKTSKNSPITLTGRFNPGPVTSLDLRASYHTIYQQIQNVTFSGSARGKNARVGFSLVHNNGRACLVGVQNIAVVSPSSTQLALAAGFVMFSGKLRLDVDGSFTADPGEDPLTGKSFTKFPQKRYRAEYYTQCCGFLAEYFERDYTTTQRRDFRFTVDLRGIGKFLDLHHGGDE